MSDSVLDRIRQNGQRPAVPTRDDTLISQVQQPEAPQSLEAVETLPEIQISAAAPMNKDALEDLKAELAKIPETNRHSAIAPYSTSNT